MYIYKRRYIYIYIHIVCIRVEEDDPQRGIANAS